MKQSASPTHEPNHAPSSTSERAPLAQGGAVSPLASLSLGNQAMIQLTPRGLNPALAGQMGNRALLRSLHGGATDRAPEASGGCGAGCVTGNLCSSCSGAIVQRKADPGGAAPRAARPMAGSSGEPLNHGLRRQLEPRFGADLSEVRVHTDSGAHSAAASVAARAFTVGNHIAFGKGAWSPDTGDGQRLLTHELTHVVQQRRAPPPAAGFSVSNPSSAAEREADANAERLDGSAAFTADAAPSAAVHRSPDDVCSADEAGSASVCTPDAASTPAMSDAGDGSDLQCAPDEPVCKPGDPVGATVDFEGLTLAFNSDYLTPLVQQYIADHGTEALRDFVQRYVAKYGSYNIRMFYGEELEDQAAPATDEEIIGDALIDTMNTVTAAEQSWLSAEFAAKANAVTSELLQASWKRVLNEAVRYGVRIDVDTDFWGDPDISYDMTDNLSTRQLGIAAGGLVRRKRALDKVESEKWGYTNDLNRYGPGYGEDEIAMSRLGTLQSAVDTAQQDLDRYRAQIEPMFPILLDYDQDADFKYDELDSLANLKSGRNADVTELIGKQIFEKVQNIAQVRQALDGGDLNVWRVPNIIAETERQLGIEVGSEKYRVVEEKVEDEQPSALTGILIGLAQLGLVLLAPVTEGATLIPAAMISGGVAYEHFKEYELESALHGTDFGPLALSQKDPSLFWLAVDIIGAGFDASAATGAAFRIFDELAPFARAAEEAGFSEKSMAELKQAAEDAGGGAQLVAALEHNAAELAGKRIGMTVEEAHEFEQAGKDLAEELAHDPNVAVAETLGGGQVKVSGRGIWVCHSPCMDLGERYAALLNERPELGKRYAELLDRGKAIPEGEAGAAARQQLARDSAAFDKELSMTAREGQWKSPLVDHPEHIPPSDKDFAAMAERRGSLQPQIDYKPPDWTGRDEALFRYGPDATLERGGDYTWVMDSDGGLSIRRLETTKPPIQFNPVSGDFEEVGSDIIRGQRGPRGPAPTLSAAEQQKLEPIFAERNRLMARRDALEEMEEAAKQGKGPPLTKAETAELGTTKGAITEQSRLIGENAAESTMRELGATRVYPTVAKPSTAGDFDQVWELNGKYYVVEAKGGSGTLGTRMTEFGRAEQGSAKYFESIAKNMRDTGATKEIRDLGRKLLAAQESGDVSYLMVRTPIGPAGPLPTEITQFVLQ